MNVNEAKRAVLDEWEKWSDQPGEFNIIKMREFYEWLEHNRPNVLTWKVGRGIDRWQAVRAWLNVLANYGGT